MDLKYFMQSFAVSAFVIMVVANIRRMIIETKGKRSIILLIITVLGSFICLWLPMHIGLIALWLYREIIRIYLNLKHGSKFCGIISGSDVLYLIGGHERNVISVLMMVECKDDKPAKEVYEMCKNVVNRSFFANPRKFPELHCVVRKFGGYFYKIKANIKIEECVKVMDTVNCQGDKVSVDELKELMSKCCNEELPISNTLFWDLFIGVQPIDWNTEDNVDTYCYPVLFRLHHAIGDGFVATQLLSILVDNIPYENQDSLNTHLNKVQEASLLRAAFYKIAVTIYAIIFNVSELLLYVLNKESPNALRSSKLSNVDVLTMKVDNGEYFRKTKQIKSTIRHSGFAHVIFTALSASLNEYFDRHAQCPKSIKLVVPFLPKTTALTQIPLGQLEAINISFHNTFSMLILDFPLIIRGSTNVNLMKRLKAVDQRAEKSYKSVTNKVMYFWTHIGMQILPISILAQVNDAPQSTAILSILPGPEQASLADGNLRIRNVMPWIPLVGGVGINITVLTYNNKLHFTLRVDKSIISNEKDAQSILNGVFKQLDLFEKELELNNN